MIYTLPISPDYVKHWRFWEAIRELLQNAYDQADSDPECKVTVDYLAKHETLIIKTSTGRLSKASLVLGNTTKANDKSQRGKFGEGYKLAMLVLRRMDYSLLIVNGDEAWSPTISHSPEYDSKVLRIDVYPIHESFFEPGVSFEIGRVSEHDWQMIQANIKPVDPVVLDDESEAGRIYVGGLYVTTVEKYRKGYSFPVGTVSLDRDRSMIYDFDLGWATSAEWSKEFRTDEAQALLEEEAPDVAYIENHVTAPVYYRHYYSFTAKHGTEAIPVTTQDEIKRATAAGKKWVLVSKIYKAVLSKVKSFFIPSSDPPAVRLKNLLDKISNSIPKESADELADVIRVLELADHS